MLRHTMGPPGKRQSPDCRVSHRPLVLIALTQDPQQLIEATVQFIGARPSVNTFFKVTAIHPRSTGDVGKKCRGEATCELMLRVLCEMLQMCFSAQTYTRKGSVLGCRNFLLSPWSCRSNSVNHLWRATPARRQTAKPNPTPVFPLKSRSN